MRPFAFSAPPVEAKDFPLLRQELARIGEQGQVPYNLRPRPQQSLYDKANAALTSGLQGLAKPFLQHAQSNPFIQGMFDVMALPERVGATVSEGARTRSLGKAGNVFLGGEPTPPRNEWENWLDAAYRGLSMVGSEALFLPGIGRAIKGINAPGTRYAPSEEMAAAQEKIGKHVVVPPAAREIPPQAPAGWGMRVEKQLEPTVDLRQGQLFPYQRQVAPGATPQPMGQLGWEYGTARGMQGTAPPAQGDLAPWGSPANMLAYEKGGKIPSPSRLKTAPLLEETEVPTMALRYGKPTAAQKETLKMLRHDKPEEFAEALKSVGVRNAEEITSDQADALLKKLAMPGELKYQGQALMEEGEALKYVYKSPRLTREQQAEIFRLQKRMSPEEYAKAASEAGLDTAPKIKALNSEQADNLLQSMNKRAIPEFPDDPIYQKGIVVPQGISHKIKPTPSTVYGQQALGNRIHDWIARWQKKAITLDELFHHGERTRQELLAPDVALVQELRKAVPGYKKGNWLAKQMVRVANGNAPMSTLPHEAQRVVQIYAEAGRVKWTASRPERMNQAIFDLEYYQGKLKTARNPREAASLQSAIAEAEHRLKLAQQVEPPYKNYIHHLRDDIAEQSKIDDALGLRIESTEPIAHIPKAQREAFMMQRYSQDLPPNLDIHDAFEASARQHANLLGWGPVRRAAQPVLDGIEAGVKGERTKSYIANQWRTIMGRHPGALDKVVNFLRQRHYSALLSMNDSALWNYTGFINSLAGGQKGSLGGLLTGVTTKGGRQIAREAGIVNETLPMLLESYGVPRSLVGKIMERADKISLAPFGWGERAMRTGTGKAAYAEAIGYGLPKQEAMGYALYKSHMLNFEFGKLGRAYWSQNNPIANAASMFGSFPVKQAELVGTYLKHREYWKAIALLSALKVTDVVAQQMGVDEKNLLMLTMSPLGLPRFIAALAKGQNPIAKDVAAVGELVYSIKDIVGVVSGDQEAKKRMASALGQFMNQGQEILVPQERMLQEMGLLPDWRPKARSWFGVKEQGESNPLGSGQKLGAPLKRYLQQQQLR